MKSPQMWCPDCATRLVVTYTRTTSDEQMTWRRKRCPQCELKVSTVEYTMAIQRVNETPNDAHNAKEVGQIYTDSDMSVAQILKTGRRGPINNVASYDVDESAEADDDGFFPFKE